MLRPFSFFPTHILRRKNAPVYQGMMMSSSWLP
jgi:hypothetical protein